VKAFTECEIVFVSSIKERICFCVITR